MLLLLLVILGFLLLSVVFGFFLLPIIFGFFFLLPVIRLFLLRSQLPLLKTVLVPNLPKSLLP